MTSVVAPRARRAAARPPRMQAGTPTPRAHAPATASPGTAATSLSRAATATEVAGARLGERPGPTRDAHVGRPRTQPHRRVQVGEDASDQGVVVERHGPVVSGPPDRRPQHHQVGVDGEVRPLGRHPRARRREQARRAGDEEARAVQLAVDAGARHGQGHEGDRGVVDRRQQVGGARGVGRQQRGGGERRCGDHDRGRGDADRLDAPARRRSGRGRPPGRPDAGRRRTVRPGRPPGGPCRPPGPGTRGGPSRRPAHAGPPRPGPGWGRRGRGRAPPPAGPR